MTSNFPLDLPDQEWQTRLSDLEYHVLRESGTEAPFTGEYTDTSAEGVYECRACGTELFRSEAKFSSHCGWPSFFEPLAEDRVIYLKTTPFPGRPVSRFGARPAILTWGMSSEARDTPPPPTRDIA